MTDINRSFLSWAPPLSAARASAISATEAEAERVKAKAPIALAITEGIITQDAVSGILTAGERTLQIKADGSVVETKRTLFDPPNKRRRLEETQARQNAAISAERDRVQAEGVDIAGVGRLDLSTASLTLFNGLVQLATLAIAAGQPFEQTITLADGDSATIDDPQTMVTAGIQIAQHMAAIYAHERELRAAVTAAKTAEAAAAIDVRAGWPSGQARDPATGRFVASNG